MEHRLVTGGEQFLPFARSRIKALKALGLPYANQSFDVDGVSIKVRIEPGHEYIRIEGGEEAIDMESGVVDTFGMLYYDVGVLHKSPENDVYQSGYTEPSPRKDVVRGDQTWLKQPVPPATEFRQLAGRVSRKPKFAGWVPPDANESRAFEPVYEHTETPAPAWVRSTSDDLLILKKMTAAMCPASMFTGKCRLYVQAMYGMSLYTYNATTKQSSANYIPALGSQFGAAPYLILQPYKNRGDDVILTTSSGIILDPATGKHWMVNIESSGTKITFYPMLGDHEKWRKYLKTSAVSELDARDKLHLEAYILATCKPDVVNKQIVNVPGLPHAYSMGYGWHWNMSGTAADLVYLGAKVHNEGVSWTIDTEGQYYTQESTHYRLSFVPQNDKPGVTVWSASMEIVSGPVEWNVYRVNVTLLAPDWALGGFYKPTLPMSQMRAVIPDAPHAPFYAYYLGDELQLCELCIETSYPGEELTVDPPEFTTYQGMGAYYADSFYTLGELPGYAEKRTHFTNVDGGRQITTVAKIGAVTTQPIYYNNSKVGFRCEHGPKTQNGYFGDPGAFSYTNMARTFEYGYPDENGVYQSESFPSGGMNWGVTVGMSFFTTVSQVTHTEVSHLTLVTPRLDAECVLYRSSNTSTTTHSSRVKRGYGALFHAQWSRHIPYIDGVGWGTPGDRYIRYQWYSGGEGFPAGASHNSLENLGDDVTADTAEQKKVVSRVEATIEFADIAECHDDSIENVSSVTLSALSGVSLLSPTVIVPGRYTTHSLPTIESPAIVGWA